MERINHVERNQHNFNDLSGRSIHILGGKPERQAQLIATINGITGAQVISVDGSYHAMKGYNGQWFQHGKWIQTRPNSIPTNDLIIASGKNIVTYLHNAQNLIQHTIAGE